MRKVHSHARWRDRVTRQRVIHEQRPDAAVVPCDPRADRLMPAINQQAFGPKPVQQFERTVRRLGDAMQIEQAKSPVKRHGRKIVLLHLELARSAPRVLRPFAQDAALTIG